MSSMLSAVKFGSLFVGAAGTICGIGISSYHLLYAGQKNTLQEDKQSTLYVIAKTLNDDNQPTEKLKTGIDQNYKCQIDSVDDVTDDLCVIEEIQITNLSPRKKQLSFDWIKQYKGQEDPNLSSLKTEGKQFKLKVSKNIYQKLKFGNEEEKINILSTKDADSSKKYAQLKVLFGFDDSSWRGITPYAAGKVSFISATAEGSKSENSFTATGKTFTCAFTSVATSKVDCTIHAIASTSHAGKKLEDLDFTHDTSNTPPTTITAGDFYLFKFTDPGLLIDKYHTHGFTFVETKESSDNKKFTITDLMPAWVISESSDNVLLHLKTNNTNS